MADILWHAWISAQTKQRPSQLSLRFMVIILITESLYLDPPALYYLTFTLFFLAWSLESTLTCSTLTSLSLMQNTRLSWSSWGIWWLILRRMFNSKVILGMSQKNYLSKTWIDCKMKFFPHHLERAPHREHCFKSIHFLHLYATYAIFEIYMIKKFDFIFCGSTVWRKQLNN